MGVIVQDTEADARRFLTEVGITFPVGFDTDLTIARSFRLMGMPLTILLARDGRVVERVMGPVGEDEFVAKVRSLL